ncbi:MAG: ABC transporter ATP-binding protein [Methanomassiliicoccales archaeon]|nr:MAG: ABC transporter ATP-binding protein [Methanomassiliicoccales archaeon]
MLGSPPIISTNGLTKYYGKRNEVKAVQDLTFDVFQGETFGLLGPNGSGKTTTIRMLNGIIRPTKGTATVNGFNIIDQAEDVKRSTGLLAESPGLYEKLSPKEYLQFVGSLYDVPKRALEDRVEKLLTLFHLQDRKDDLMEGFSKGMRQKVLIGAALVHDPPIVFLDEPTSALDPRAALMVKDLIKDLSSKANKTIFISSHILSLIEEVCDRVAIIDKGRLVAIGSVDEIAEMTGKETLEAAFISLTGGEDRSELLSWRGDPADA